MMGGTGMRLHHLLFAAVATAGLAGSMAAAFAQDQERKVDIRTVPCSDLDKAEDGDRIAAIFFFYGFHAAQLGLLEVSPANLERNVHNIVAFCHDNPAMPIYEAVPRAFQR